MFRRIHIGLCVAFLFGWSIASMPSRTHAQTHMRQREVNVQWKKNQPYISVSAEYFLSTFVKQKLESGLPQNMSIKVFAHTQNSGSNPIAAATLTCKVMYDLWEEVFRIHQTKNLKEQHFISKSIRGVGKKCFSIQSLQVPISVESLNENLPQIWFSVELEFNPLSNSDVEKIRYWLSRSSRTSSDRFFGSFVSFFVNQRVGRAERLSRFRSQMVPVPK